MFLKSVVLSVNKIILLNIAVAAIIASGNFVLNDFLISIVISIILSVKPIIFESFMKLVSKV